MTGVGGELSLVAALVGGMLALLSPCSALLVPSMFAYAFDRPGLLLRRSVMLYAGLVVTLVPLGVAASSLTVWMRAHQATVIAVGGVVVIALGILQVLGRGFVMLPSRLQGVGQGDTTSRSVFVLGMVYGLAGFCTGPILGSILVLAAVGGHPVRGGVLLAVYGLGMVIPVFLLALAWNRLGASRLQRFTSATVTVAGRDLSVVSLVSGIVFVAIGLALVLGADQLAVATGLALAGADLEAALTSLPQWVEVVVLGLLAAAGVGWGLWRLRHDMDEAD